MKTRLAAIISGLQSQRQQLAVNLVKKGVNASTQNTLTQLIEKVTHITGGGDGNAGFTNITGQEELYTANVNGTAWCNPYNEDIGQVSGVFSDTCTVEVYPTV